MAEPHEERDRKILRVLVLVLGANLLTAAGKLVVGGLAGSLALLADGVHALLDASSNVVGIVGIKAASRPPDEGHPYGHRRYEAVAALLIGLLIAAGLLGVVEAIVTGILEDRKAPDVSWPVFAVVAVAALGGLLLSRYEQRQGKKLRSSVLTADAGHTMSDALGSAVVLLSFVGAWLGASWADIAGASVVCFFIGRTAYQVVAANLGVLADSVQLDADEVAQVAGEVAGVLGTHKIRSRGTTDHVHVDLHIQLAPSVTLTVAHETTHLVARAIQDAFPQVHDVVIHTEPAPNRD